MDPLPGRRSLRNLSLETILPALGLGQVATSSFQPGKSDFFQSLGPLGLQAEIGADVAIGAMVKANLSLEEGHLTGFRPLLGTPALHAPDLPPTPSRPQLQKPFPLLLA